MEADRRFIIYVMVRYDKVNKVSNRKEAVDLLHKDNIYWYRGNFSMVFTKTIKCNK